MKFYLNSFQLRLLTTLIAFLTFFEVKSQESLVGFQEQIITDDSHGTDNPVHISQADLDGDGDLDVLSVSINDNKIAWYENLDGLGNFGEQQMISENVDKPVFISTGDLDGDGDLDVLSAIEDENTIVWYENIDGLGNFGDQNIITNNLLEPVAVLAVDIDNDNDLDIIAIADSFSKAITLYENIDGLGNFGSEVIISPEANPSRSFSSADIDGDGDNDIVAGSTFGNNIAWYENLNGEGVFGEEQIISNNASVSSQNVLCFDIDNDGDLDVLISSSSNDTISWYENLDGSGNFSDQIIIDNSSNNVLSTMFGDLDGDGDTDILATITDDDMVVWYENLNGTGNFGSRQVIVSNVNFPNFVTLADLNNDNTLDILIAYQIRDQISWVPNIDNQGIFGELNDFFVYAHLPEWVEVIDIDGDSDLDVFFASAGDDKIGWYENLDGAGNFGEQIIISEVIPSPNSISIGDIDNDGDLDIVASSSFGENKIFWFENTNGLGDFDLKQNFGSAPTTSLNVEIVDIDNDGHKDIITQFRWYRNLDGLGTFENNGVIFSVPFEASPVRRIKTIDIDSDGDQDIMGIGDGVFISINTGSGFFNPLLVSGNGGTDIRVGDLDNDGDYDLITANPSNTTSSSEITWHENLNNTGNFNSWQFIAPDEIEQYFDLEIFDFDNDGDLDLFAGIPNRLYSFENIGGPGFDLFAGRKLISNRVNDITYMTYGDINFDGLKDLLLTARGDSKISWFENLGELGNQIYGAIGLNEDIDECGNSNDVLLSNIMVTTNNGENTFSTFTQNDGSYIINTNEGEFTTTVSSALPEFYDVLPNSHTSTFEGLNNIDEANNFCITPNQVINDVNVIMYPLDNARPGFDASYEIIFTNSGTLLSSGAIELNYNNEKLTFLSADSDIFTQSENTIIFNYTNLQPLNAGHIILDFNIFPPPTTEIDDLLSFEVSISPDEVDETPEDNIYSLDQIVIGSFDPNDILVLEGPEILVEEVDNYLHYIIRFQNTGTADAINVRVTNQLDPNLDWTTTQLESLSHPGVVNIINGNEVEFLFEGINLPAEIDNPEGSNGYIAYRIKPIEGLDIGDTIFNDAAIFFDFNPPIITNTVSTTVVDESLSLTDSESILSTRLFPNPSESKIIIDSEIILSKIEVYNTIGTTILRKINPKGIDSINIEELASGIYFIKLSNKEESNSIIRKIVKQ